MSIQDRIKEVKKHFKLTTAQMAELLEFPKRTLYAYESGENPPSVAFVKELAKKFNINPNWMILNIEPKFIENGNNETDYEVVRINIKKNTKIIIDAAGPE